MPLPNRLTQPAFLQKLQWIADPVSYMENAAQQYPDLFTAEPIGAEGSSIFVHHPQALQEILTNDRKTFTAPGNLNTLLQPVVGDESLFMLDGDRHRQRRQLVMPSFHGDRMRAYGQQICDLTERIFSQLSDN